MNHEAMAGTDSLNESPPGCSAEFAADLVHRAWGIEGRARQLACERDQIFIIDCEPGEGFVLRLTNPAEQRQVTNFQTEAMCHLNRVDPDLPVPCVVPGKDGDTEIEVLLPDNRSSIARLITLLPGVPLATAPERNPGLRSCMADTIARMGLAFSGFSHPGSNHELLWDMQHAPRLRKLVGYLEDHEIRMLVERGLDAFEAKIEPIQSQLRSQVIHNDFNFSNVMIDEQQPEITGVLDFGDMVHAPLVYDLAVALAYQLSGDGDDALDVIETFTSRYHQIVPLQAEELEILFDLITTRQILSLLITRWRASVYPENREYILRNYVSSETGIRRLAALTRDRVTQVLLRSCLSR